MDTGELSDLLPFDQRYELRRQLSCDGPYRGWHALDRLLNREVVVNVAYEHLADVDAFLNRARIRSRLRHPNLIPIYDLGITSEKLPFFTQPWIETIDLNWLVSEWETKEHTRPASPLNAAVRYLREACKAVECVHQHGYVYVHLNPGRVVIHEPFDEVFVTGELHDANTALDEMGRVVGNPAYIAPGQLTGPARPTAASDVYGLGGTLYWILHGEPPNCVKDLKSTIQALAQLSERKTPPPKLKTRPMFADRSVKRRIEDLQDIALDALEPLPERRTETVAMFSEHLDDWIARS